MPAFLCTALKRQCFPTYYTSFHQHLLTICRGCYKVASQTIPFQGINYLNACDSQIRVSNSNLSSSGSNLHLALKLYVWTSCWGLKHPLKDQ